MHHIDLTIPSREKDLGGFTVSRILPYVKRRMVGPFIFLDHMGPADFPSGQGMDVSPHPHVGLATLTYLFVGELLHRDSLGTAQNITPGEINWMTAGGGITHSERTGADERARAHQAHGLQSWVALPKEFEDMAPEFFHYSADALPVFDVPDVQMKLIAGRAFGHEAPTKIYSPLFYLEANLDAGASLNLPPDYRERALYLISGELRIGDDTVTPKTMPVFTAGNTVRIEAVQPSHIMLLGGEPLPEARYIDWNFVSSSKERILHAKEEWRAQRFPKIPGDDREFVPLPEGLS